MKTLWIVLFCLFSTSLFAIEKEVVVVNNGWHSGLVFKTSDINTAVWPQSRDFSKFEYVEVGWGDEDFYRSADPGFWQHIKAAVWPTSSVLHIRGFNILSRNYNKSKTHKLILQHKKYDNICRYIQKSYLIKNGKSIQLGKGLFENSIFYRSSQTYHIAKTCNAWTAEALKEADLDITPMLSITTKQLFEQLNDTNNRK